MYLLPWEKFRINLEPPPKFTGPYIWGDQIFWVALGVAVKWIKLVQGKKEASAWKKRLLAGYLDPPPGEMWVPFVFSNSLADGVKRSICAVGCQKGLCEKRVHDLGGGGQLPWKCNFTFIHKKSKHLLNFMRLPTKKRWEWQSGRFSMLLGRECRKLK